MAAMTPAVLAVYQGGVLRPVHPLPLAEGETVTITWASPENAASVPEKDESVKRIRAAKTLEEWIVAAKAIPDNDDGYDLLQALDENRKVSGDQRPLFESLTEGASR
jgi:predicted DNA-binding antitoxin AbrB/MazE fold protein